MGAAYDARAASCTMGLFERNVHENRLPSATFLKINWLVAITGARYGARALD